MATIRIFASSNGITYFYNECGQVLNQIDTNQKQKINRYLATMPNVNFVDVEDNCSGVPMVPPPVGWPNCPVEGVSAPEKLAWIEKEITMPVKVKAATVTLSADEVEQAIVQYVRREFFELSAFDSLHIEKVITAVSVIVTRKLT